MSRPRIGVAREGCLAAWAHAKLDGNWTRVVVPPAGGGEPRFLTTTPADVTDRVPGRARDAAARLPRGPAAWSALGELWAPGRPASAVRSLLATGAGREELELTWFGLEGEVPLPGRGGRPPGAGEVASLPMGLVAEFFAGLGLPFAPLEPLSDDGLPKELGESELELLRGRARSAGLEGWVLKTANLTGWLKLKCELSLEAFVTGWAPGRGKLAGLPGSLEVSVLSPAGPVAVADVGGSSMTLAELAEARDALGAGRLLGRVMEVTYQRVDSGGRLRHPRFAGWREDREAAWCLASQDPDLLAAGRRRGGEGGEL